MEQQNRIALVTGGNRGLGKDMALSLAQKGIHVVLTYNSNADMAQTVVKEIEALGVKSAALQLDLNDFTKVDAFTEAFKSILNSHFNATHFNYLINNAGIGKTVPFGQVSTSMFDEFMNVHFKSVYFMSQALVPLMASGGSIVNVSSGTTRFSIPGYSVYASMKGAVEVLTKYMAKELGAQGIRANIVAPGPIETDFNDAAIRNNPQMKAFLSTLSPLGRVGNADDIGGVVAFLCSDESRWINGQRIEVSGGINV